jgi:3-dehydroquinate synthase class II
MGLQIKVPKEVPDSVHLRCMIDNIVKSFHKEGSHLVVPEEFHVSKTDMDFDLVTIGSFSVVVQQEYNEYKRLQDVFENTEEKEKFKGDCVICEAMNSVGLGNPCCDCQ